MIRGKKYGWSIKFIEFFALEIVVCCFKGLFCFLDAVHPLNQWLSLNLEFLAIIRTLIFLKISFAEKNIVLKAEIRRIFDKLFIFICNSVDQEWQQARSFNKLSLPNSSYGFPFGILKPINSFFPIVIDGFFEGACRWG